MNPARRKRLIVSLLLLIGIGTIGFVAVVFILSVTPNRLMSRGSVAAFTEIQELRGMSATIATTGPIRFAVVRQPRADEVYFVAAVNQNEVPGFAERHRLLIEPFFFESDSAVIAQIRERVDPTGAIAAPPEKTRMLWDSGHSEPDKTVDLCVSELGGLLYGKIIRDR